MTAIVADSLDGLIAEAPRRLAGGFQFTEGPLWDPKGWFYFVDLFASRQYTIIPGDEPELFRSNISGGNGTTFDLDGRLVICEAGNRRVVRLEADGNVTVLADRFEGKRLNRPNDAICGKDGSIYFTDPGLKLALADRELTQSGVYRVRPDGALSLVADVEYPNGLAFSPDENVLYVANTRWTQYIHRLELDSIGVVKRRGVLADMSSDDATHGIPDGMKVDAQGRIYCTGPNGVWVFAPDGQKLGIIPVPEIPANLAFGGEDLKTVLITAHHSVYVMRLNVAGNPHPFYSRCSAS